MSTVSGPSGPNKGFPVFISRQCHDVIIRKTCGAGDILSRIRYLNGRHFSLLFSISTECAAMGTLVESKEALRSRGLEVSLTEAEVDRLIANRG